MAKPTNRVPIDRYSEQEKNRALLAVVYSRIDYEASGFGELSLDDQEQTNCRWARQNTWDVVECIRDTSCRYSTDIPGLQRLRQLLDERRVDVVVAYSPDRIARCQEHLQQLLVELEEAGASLEFVVDRTPRAQRCR